MDWASENGFESEEIDKVLNFAEKNLKLKPQLITVNP